MSAEQAADLAKLQAAVNDAPLVPGQEPPAPEIDPREKIAGEITGLVLAFVQMARPILPSLAEIYTPEATGAAAAAVAGVCVKHGWLDGGLMGEWGEEIAAAAVLLPMGLATYQGVSADLARLKQKDGRAAQLGAPDLAATAAETVPEAPGGKTVQVGTVMP